MNLSPISLAITMLGQVYDPRMDLFGAGEPGVWYDPSDLSTMFQDAAGTVPVTGVEQPVGMILDKSGRGNHATQSTTTSRPVLSARYNQILNSEAIASSPWSGLDGATATNNAGTSPTGTSNATLIDLTATGSARLAQANSIASPANIAETLFSVWLRAETAPGTVALQGRRGDGTLVNTLANVTTEWQRFTLAIPAASGASASAVWIGNRLVGGTCHRFFAWGAQLITTNALPSNAYQRVTTATDYDSNPALFPYYLLFDGVDDSMATGSINFTSTDKMTVVAGVRKLSDAAAGMLVELSASVLSNNGSFSILAPSGSSATYGFVTRGTSTPWLDATGVPAPRTDVLTAGFDLAAASAALAVTPRLNAQTPSITNIDTSAPGAGTYGNYPLFIGRRGGTALPFNGRLYSLIVRGAASSAAQISAAERWVASKTGVTL